LGDRWLQFVEIQWKPLGKQSRRKSEAEINAQFRIINYLVAKAEYDFTCKKYALSVEINCRAALI
jgi:hypothetical protein